MASDTTVALGESYGRCYDVCCSRSGNHGHEKKKPEFTIVSDKSALKKFKEQREKKKEEEDGKSKFNSQKVMSITQNTMKEFQFNNMLGIGKQRSNFTFLHLTPEEQYESHKNGIINVLKLLPRLSVLIKNNKSNKIRQNIDLLDSYVEQVARINPDIATKEHHHNISNLLIDLWNMFKTINKPILRLMYWLIHTNMSDYDVTLFDCLKEITKLEIKKQDIYITFGIGFAKSFLRMYSDNLTFENATVIGTSLLYIIDGQKKNNELYHDYIKKQGIRAIDAKKSLVIQDYRLVCHATGCYKVESDELFKTCGKCKKTIYCSSDCQQKDWSTHKTTCH